MMEFPRVTITLDHMRHQVVHAMGEHTDELIKFIDAELSRQIKSFDYAHEIRVIVSSVLSDAIKEAVTSYYKYGDGKNAIDAEVRTLLDKVMVKR